MQGGREVGYLGLIGCWRVGALDGDLGCRIQVARHAVQERRWESGTGWDVLGGEDEPDGGDGVAQLVDGGLEVFDVVGVV